MYLSSYIACFNIACDHSKCSKFSSASNYLIISWFSFNSGKSVFCCSLFLHRYATVFFLYVKKKYISVANLCLFLGIKYFWNTVQKKETQVSHWTLFHFNTVTK